MATAKDGKLIGYCRVSTAPHTVQLQRDALDAAGCNRIFQDKVSTSVKERTGLLAAELERDMLQERTLAGLAAAREQGRIGGRPTVMNPDKLAAAQARRANGESPTQIAKALGVSRASVYRHLSPK